MEYIEERSIENPAVPLESAYDYLVEQPKQTVVNAETILGIPAIYQGLRLLCSKFGSLGVKIYEKKGNGGRTSATSHPAYRLLRRSPNPDTVPSVFLSSLLMQTIVYGNGYCLVNRDQAANPVELELLDPESIAVKKLNGRLVYEYTPDQDTKRTYLGEDVLHMRGINYNGICGTPIWLLLKGSLGLTLGMQRYTEVFFKNGAKIGLAITLPKGLKDPEKIKRFGTQIKAHHEGVENAHRILLLEDEADIKEFGGNNQSAQLTELTQDQIRACANIIGCPPSYMGITDGYTSHNSLEQQQKQLLADCLNPWLIQFEEAAERVLLKEVELEEETHYVEFNREALDATDTKTKEESLIAQLSNNCISWEEYREIKNLPTTRKGTFFRMANVNCVESDTFQPPKPEPIQAAPVALDQGQPQAKALATKTVKRLVERVRKSVEQHTAKGDLMTWLPTYDQEHRSVWTDSLDCFANGVAATDGFLDELRQELGAGFAENVDWNRYQTDILKQIGA